MKKDIATLIVMLFEESPKPDSIQKVMLHLTWYDNLKEDEHQHEKIEHKNTSRKFSNIINEGLI